MKKSKVIGIKNKKGGWDIKIKAESDFEVLSFYIVGFTSFLDQLDSDERKNAKDAMVKFVNDEEVEE